MNKREKCDELIDTILEDIIEEYLSSREFNGYSFPNIENPDFNNAMLLIIKGLIQSDYITIETGKRFINPFIKAFDPPTIEEQLKEITDLPMSNIVLYPSVKYLKTKVSKDDYEDLPFTLKMALGEPHFKYYSFKLDVLKKYALNPQYELENHGDLCGKIITNDENLEEQDYIYLKTYGYSYSKDNRNRRAVCVPLTYLSKLSNQQQLYWKSCLIPDQQAFEVYHEYKLVLSGLGSHLQELSLIESILLEVKYINQILEEKFSTSLFKTHERPSNLNYILIPTLKEFQDFTRALDLILQENINKSFFKEQGLELTFEHKENNQTIKKNKGTIRLLSEWLDSLDLDEFESSSAKNLVERMKNVYKERSKASHSDIEDHWNEDFFCKQRDLLVDLLKSLRETRLGLHRVLNSNLNLPLYNSWSW